MTRFNGLSNASLFNLLTFEMSPEKKEFYKFAKFREVFFPFNLFHDPSIAVNKITQKWNKQSF